MPQRDKEQVIWLARHGARIDKVDRQWTAQAARPFDPHLADVGFQEAARLAARLAHEPIDAVYASPYLRAAQTAAPIAEVARVPLYLEPGMGEWMKPDHMDAAPTLMPDVDTGWTHASLDLSYRSPATLTNYPETWDEVAVRAAEAIRRLAATGANMVVVGHGATVLTAVAALQNITSAHDPPAPRPASVYKLVRRDGIWHVELEADDAHLRDVTYAPV